MSEKIIVMNSGGFDSTVLANRVREIYPEAEILNLFFDYTQPSYKPERDCSYRTAYDLGFEFMEVKVPPFLWTSGKFYKKSFETSEQYIEYRNLVFLSYAVSIAEAYGYSKIFMALFYVPDTYKDCSISFIDHFNKLIAPSGIKVITPFAWIGKEDLYKMAQRYGIEKDNGAFFSCNCPKVVDGRLVPCGICGDCADIDRVYGEFDDFDEEPLEDPNFSPPPTKI